MVYSWHSSSQKAFFLGPVETTNNNKNGTSWSCIWPCVATVHHAIWPNLLIFAVQYLGVGPSESSQIFGLETLVIYRLLCAQPSTQLLAWAPGRPWQHIQNLYRLPGIEKFFFIFCDFHRSKKLRFLGTSVINSVTLEIHNFNKTTHNTIMLHQDVFPALHMTHTCGDYLNEHQHQ
jgi:hypothetical protein